MTVYLYKVLEIKSGCELPELSDTLLALTGISSATFLVLRTKENDPPIQQVQQANSVPVVPTPATPVDPSIAKTSVPQNTLNEPILNGQL